MICSLLRRDSAKSFTMYYDLLMCVVRGQVFIKGNMTLWLMEIVSYAVQLEI